MRITKHDIVRWHDDPVTKKLKKLLLEYSEIIKDDILNIDKENKDSFYRDYYYLKGQLIALKTVLEAELEEENKDEFKEV